MVNLYNRRRHQEGKLLVPAADWVARPDTDLRLELRKGREGFDESEVAQVAAWIDGWRVKDPHLVIVMAAEPGQTLATRRTRLKDLRDLMQLLGVPRENIKYTEQELSSHESRSANDAIWIKRLDTESAGCHVQSVASCFGDRMEAA